MRNHTGLVLALSGLSALALSQRPALGGWVLFDPGVVPDWLQNMRSSGRFFWPVAYVLLMAAVLLAARHPHRATAAALLAAIGVLQFADAAELRQKVQQRVARYGAHWQVDEEALRVLLMQSEGLTLLPSWLCVPGNDGASDREMLRQLMVLASEIGLPVSTTYVARWQGRLRCDDQEVAAAPLGAASCAC